MLDLGIDLNIWPWVWLFVGVVFVAIELTLLGGSFVLLPFAVSAFAAALLGFYDVAIEIQWAVFFVGGALLWVLLYKRVMKFVGENDLAPGVGADRLVGMTAIVTATIDPDDTDRKGRVKVEGEVWSALTTGSVKIADGTRVRITEMIGTRVMVESIPATLPNGPASGPPLQNPSTSTSPSSEPPSNHPPPNPSNREQP